MVAVIAARQRMVGCAFRQLLGLLAATSVVMGSGQQWRHVTMVGRSAVMVAARIAKWKLDTAAVWTGYIRRAQTLALSCVGMGREIVQSNVTMETQQTTTDAL